MLSKLKKWIKNSKGPFTKEGEYLDYTEVHVFMNAVLYGLGRTTADKGWKKLVEREEGADEEYTYFHYGYVIGNRGKVAAITLLGAGGAKKLGFI